MAIPTNSKLKSGLQAWAKKNGISINDFRQKMQYTYAYAWDLLRGKAEFTPEAYGRFVLAYGYLAGQDVLELAEATQGMEGMQR
jgi:hypothetical protein